MGLRCHMCSSIFANLSLLLNHWMRVHGQDANLNIVCGVGGCGRTYRNFFGYRSHLQRNHNDLWKNASEITELCDLVNNEDHNIEQNLSDDSDDDATNGDIFKDNGEKLDNGDENDAHDEDDEDDEAALLRCSRAAYLLRIMETHNLTQKALNDIVANTNMLIQHAVQTTCETVVRKLRESTGEDYSGQISWEVLSDEDVMFGNPFQGLETKSDQRKTFKELFGFVKPVKRVLGNYHGHRRRGTKRMRVELSDECIDVPLLASLEQMLNDPSILYQVENTHQRVDGIIADFCDRDVYANHPLFSRDPKAIQIFLYYDDVEVVNPLGSKTSKHKFGVFYYTLGNINPLHRSQLKCIQIVSIAKRPVIKKYGINVILQAFMHDLSLLEQDGGHQFTINGHPRSFAGTLAFVSGDNLGSQEVGGFKIGPAAALKCRECMGNAEDIKTMFSEDDFQLRTRDGYNNNCTSIELSDADVTGVYGINHRSILNQSRYFHVVEGLPGDAMHDVLEGVLQYETKEFLKYAINEQSYFSLDQLNQWIQHFDFGYADASNKPSSIGNQTLNSTTNSLKQKASQMWCLGRFLPLLVGAHVPREDEKWQLYITLLEIMDVVFSPAITANKAAFLKDLIEDHHNRFVQLYPDASIIPKMHYIIHYPRTMLRVGPIVRSWCMRFEAKHERLKRLASVIGNFTNIPWTLANRHQLRQCYELSCGRNGQPLITKPTEIGQGIQKEAQATGYFQELHEKMDSVREEDMIYEAKWCSIHGTKYKIGAVVHTGYIGLLPKFSIIKNITVTNPADLDGSLFFVVKDIPTLEYATHTHSYKVSRLEQGPPIVLRQTELVTFLPMNLCTPIDVEGVTCVCPKYDIDVYNEQL